MRTLFRSKDCELIDPSELSAAQAEAILNELKFSLKEHITHEVGWPVKTSKPYYPFNALLEVALEDGVSAWLLVEPIGYGAKFVLGVEVG